MSSGRAGRELRAWSPECEASPPPLASLFAGPNMQGPNLHGIMGQLAGKVRLASATHRSACTQHRPCAIAAKRAEVHQGHEDERDHVGQRDHVQLANNTQGCDQGCRIMSRRSQGGGRSVAPAQRPPRCLPASVDSIGDGAIYVPAKRKRCGRLPVTLISSPATSISSLTVVVCQVTEPRR